MGFKFKRFIINGGSEDLPTGTTATLLRQKSETLLKNIVQLIINTNTGWAMDSRTPTTTSFVEVPDSASTPTYWPGLFLYNSNSGCKLFAAYIGKTGIKNFSGNDLFISAGNNAGFCLSMIPAGSTNSFGATFDSSFLPSDATRIIGCSTGNYTTAYNAAGNISYCYGIFATDSIIGICVDEGATTAPKYLVGKIIGSNFHETDNLYTSKYGVFRVRIPFSSGSSTDAGGTLIYQNNAPVAWSSSGVSVLGTNNSIISASYCSCSITKANGTWISTDGSSYCVKIIPECIEQLGAFVNLTNGTKSRWVPYVVGLASNDPSTYGIIPGDGMKGYLDTDLFRCAIGTYGQQFDNGNFLCIDGTYNFLIGWDPTNDPLVGT